LSALPKGGTVGSSSLRRQAQLLNRRPDLKIVAIRGNVETRLRKLDDGAVDAVLLALAGLRRLDLADRVTEILAAETMLPAVGQGAVGVACRADDDKTRALLAALDHPPTAICVAAERAMLAALDGSCRTPIGGLAELNGKGNLTLRGLVAKPDGSGLLEIARTGKATDTKAAEAIGRDVGDELKRRAGPGYFG
jgi:hydroxymethylbilane synthase